MYIYIYISTRKFSCFQSARDSDIELNVELIEEGVNHEIPWNSMTYACAQTLDFQYLCK